MTAAEPPSAEDVFDLFASLSGEDQQAFLRLLGQNGSAEVLFLIAHELSLSELGRFSEMIHQELMWQSFPLFVQEARRLALEQQQISDEEFDKLVNERVSERMAEYDQKIGKLERARLKEARDPKPQNRERDDEIVRLRDKKH
jgi:hypothetical protein